MSLFFGFHMPNFTFADAKGPALFDRVVEQAKAAEAAGFDLVTVMDHFYQIGGIGPETDPMLEAYTTLGAIARETTRVKLGDAGHGRHLPQPRGPGQAGDHAGRHLEWPRDARHRRCVERITSSRGYGIEFPPIAERMERLDEALTIAKLMFTEERPSFQGKHYRIENALNSPRPIQPGGPKIMIGGGGEKKTLRILAKHGDVGHWFGGDLEDLKRKKRVFEEHCTAVGRDPSQVLLTLGAGILIVESEREGKALLERIPEQRRASFRAVTPEQGADVLQGYVDAGFGGFTFNNPTLPTVEAIARAGELIKLMNSKPARVA